MQAKIGAILNDPETMQKIMSMAQAMGQAAPKPPPEPSAEEPPAKKQDVPGFSLTDIDLKTVQKLAGLTGKANIDNNQKALLKALGPYLSRDRVSKLERAMRAAKIASLASSFLGANPLLSNQGR